MAHLSDEELNDLKTRVISAMGTGANIGRANDYLLQLIAEIQEHRSGGPPQPKPKIGVLKVGELDVKKADPVENIPTVKTTPEETKELIEKTKKPEKSGKKK